MGNYPVCSMVPPRTDEHGECPQQSWAWAIAGVAAQADTKFKYLNEFQTPQFLGSLQSNAAIEFMILYLINSKAHFFFIS